MGDMRKSLMDIILMETTVSKAANILQPLQQLSQLRRMSNADVREAARTIMEQRTSRLARHEDETTTRAASPKLQLDDVEVFGDDQAKDIFVPTPREDNVDTVIDSLEE